MMISRTSDRAVIRAGRVAVRRGRVAVRNAREVAMLRLYSVTENRLRLLKLLDDHEEQRNGKSWLWIPSQRDGPYFASCSRLKVRPGNTEPGLAGIKSGAPQKQPG